MSYKNLNTADEMHGTKNMKICFKIERKTFFSSILHGK